MAFPTIPTAAAGRVVTGTQTGTSGTRTFPSLTGLTKNSGDLLIAIICAYQSSASAGSVFSSWGASFTEFLDVGGASNGCIGAAYKVSNGGETGTFTVTQAATVTGDAAFILLSIPNGSQLLAPVGGTITNGTSAAADPASLNPATWGTLDTLWIAIANAQETSTTSTFTGVASAPTNYGNYADTGISQDAVGGVEGAVAFRQLNAASEDPGGFTIDITNARNSVVLIAVAPHPQLVTLGIPTETDSPQTLIHDRMIQRTLTEVTETDLANEIISLQTLPATETTSPQALNIDKALGVTTATETSSAQTLSFTQDTSYTLGVVSETDATPALDVDKAITVTLAAETDAAQALTLTKPIIKTITTATETDAAQTVSYSQAGNFDLTLAAETDSAQALNVDKAVTIAHAGETGTANEIIALQPLPATETDSAIELAYGVGGRTLLVVGETDSAQALTATKPIRKTLTLASETDTAQAVTGGTTGNNFDLTPATETDLANTIIPLQPLPATTTDTAQALTHVQGALSLTPATSTASAQTLTHAKGVTLPTVEHTPPLPYNTTNIGDTSSAIALVVTSGATNESITPATTTDSAQALDKDKAATLARASETDTADDVTFSGPTTVTLGIVNELDSAPTLTATKPIYKTITTATSTATATVLDVFNPAYSITQATSTATAVALTVTKTIYKDIVEVGAHATAPPLVVGNAFPFEHCSTADSALTLTYGKLNRPGKVGVVAVGRISGYKAGGVQRAREEVPA